MKTNLILKQIKKVWKNAMRAREPNSWPIRCNRTWIQELAVSCPSTVVHVEGGRSSPRNFWCFWYDELLELPSKYLCPSSLKTLLLRLQVRRTLKGVFLCAACLLLVAEIEWPSHCKCELVWNWTKKYWRTQASMPLCELWNFNFNGNELQIS